MTWR